MDKGLIFVSSTCYDLIDLRAELEQHLRLMGLTPVMSGRPATEFVVPGDTNSIETCLTNLRRCTAVVVVLSQRYGPKLGKYGFPDVSATHLEYNTAIDEKIPTLVYARDRLLAELESRKRHDKAFKRSWLPSDDDLGLLDLLDQHKKLHSGKVNWVWQFTSSVDLKSRLAIDLEADARAAGLEMLVRSGNLPSLSFTTGSGTIDSCALIARNAGLTPALGCILMVGRMNHVTRFGDVPAGGEKPAVFNNVALFGPGPKRAVLPLSKPLWAAVDYTTADGHLLRDTLGAVVDQGWVRSFKTVSREYLGRVSMPSVPPIVQSGGFSFLDI